MTKNIKNVKKEKIKEKNKKIMRLKNNEIQNSKEYVIEAEIGFGREFQFSAS